VFEGVHFVLDLLEVAEGGERRFVDGRTGFKVHMLFEQTEAQSAHAHNVAAVGGFLAGDQAKNRRFTGAVPAHQPDVLARIDLERRAAQNLLRGVGFFDVGEAKEHVTKIDGRFEFDATFVSSV
jgi:hypothetical protein